MKTKQFYFLLPILIIIILLSQNQESQGKNIKVKKLFSIGEGENVPDYEIFGQITDMTCDQQGNLYVADRKESRVQKFDKDGNFLFSIGQKGQGPGEFLGFLDIAIDKNGYLYIHDTGNTRLSKYSPEGKLLLSINTKNPNRSRINFLENGFLTIYRYDYREYMLNIFNKNLKFQKMLIKSDEEITKNHRLHLSHRIYEDIVYFFLRKGLTFVLYSTEGKFIRSVPIKIPELKKIRDKNIALSKNILSKPRNIGYENFYLDNFHRSLIVSVDIFVMENRLKLEQTILFRLDLHGNFIEKIEIDQKVFSLISFYNNGFYIFNSDGYVDKYRY